MKANYSRFAAPLALASAVQYLIVANLVIFVLELLGPINRMFLEFGLMPYKVVYQGAIWQLVTGMFLHGGYMHIGINLLVLWFIGPPVERVWGMKRFFIYYFVSGIGANLIVILLALTVVPEMMYVVTIGASGAIYGVLLAFGLLFPEQMVYLYFLFPIKAKYFVILAAAFAFFSEAGNLTPGINNWAHLGGMLFGLVYLKGRGWLRQLSGRLGG
ncbi:MAG TPA: rhomboid family intramembrane serine protease [Candidatus Fraserbacteria bacterium]|nr:rhomboid family intramembrane serine protease [Candidatus Fraserbacteria bacterium]